MAIDKIQSESINLADNFAFTVTVTGAGGNNQPYFTAYQAGNYSIPHNTNTNLVLTSTTVNSGTAYSTSNGRFTPQVAGDYFCNFTFSGRHGSSGNAVVLFESNTQWCQITNFGAYKIIE